MSAIVVAATLVTLGISTPPTLATTVRAACTQLGIDAGGLTVPAALQACNKALGIDATGPLLIQADVLATQLGLDRSTPAPTITPTPPPRLGPPMPKMVVFDLDFTLWKPELYQLSSGSPFSVSSDGCVLTARGERLELFPAARTALTELADAGVPIAIASRAGEVEWAYEIMRLMPVDRRRTMAGVIGDAPVVIQGGSKTHHLKHISAESGVKLADMLFFDNERTNIMEVDKLGVTCAHCPRGMTEECYRDGVQVHVSGSDARAGGGSGKERRGGRRGAEEEDGEEDGKPRRGARDRKGGRGGRRGR